MNLEQGQPTAHHPHPNSKQNPPSHTSPFPAQSNITLKQRYLHRLHAPPPSPSYRPYPTLSKATHLPDRLPLHLNHTTCTTPNNIPVSTSSAPAPTSCKLRAPRRPHDPPRSCPLWAPIFRAIERISLANLLNPRPWAETLRQRQRRVRRR